MTLFVSAEEHLSTIVINPLLLQVLVCGAELYTSNTALMPVAYYERKASLQQVMTPALCTWLWLQVATAS